MKLTEQHVSEETINKLISTANTARWATPGWKQFGQDVVFALLELKQRRAEDRQRENDGR
jgi:hypothetical protein